MTTLLAITDDLQRLDAMLTESEGEITPEIQALMDSIGEQLPSKVDGIGFYWRSLERQADAYRHVSKEFAEKLRIEENKLARFREYLMRCVAAMPDQKAKGELYALAIQKNGGKRPLRLVVNDPLEWPEEWQKKVVSIDTEQVRHFAENHLNDVGPDQPTPITDRFGHLLATLEPRGESVRLR